MGNMIRIPAIRSQMGIWIYYVSSLSFNDILDYISPINDELHKSRFLSEMIQRSVTENYKNIANYLETQEERFFNSLILAVYDGEPEWNEIRISEFEDGDSPLGILTLSGKEKIFPVDGQHRVAGIKKALENKPILGKERVPVIFVGHSKDEVGMQRTRRMFSTLNRYAKPVSLRDIIALDEDDVVAIASRNLIDDTDLFLKDRILDSKSKSVPETNRTALTTIIAYYECNKELLWLFVKDIDVIGLDGKPIRGRKKVNEYIRHRPSERIVNDFTKECYEFWKLIMLQCTKLNNYTDGTVGRFRDKEGGHIFFRPVALVQFAKVIVRIRESTDMEYKQIFKLFPERLMWLQHKLWRRILWDNIQKRMIMGNSKLVELLLIYIIDPQLLTNNETQKLVTGLQSVWDMQKNENVLEILDEIISEE
ncbi:DNA sulfur modification protein DndB [[Clostridium] scindens]|uniref:DNA sulfur modification protein DndB n=1 Tax=Clostridium scindens (strain JCM 10418 / VPI 12708) TaxID=29347 RepID=UPI00156E64D9|nr:DNA sulfur modification protein DndB [[Clostridium] scindens]NSI90783.1 DGQHR domain-containing protein [[Clostridium] scindens]NSJ05399.1 DGQHR domain-containing protein [[Clostridium] scindens]